MPEISHDVYTERWAHLLAPGLRVEPHRHPYHLLVYANDGMLDVTTSAGTWAAPRNRAVWIPSGVEHAHVAHGRTDMRSVGFESGGAPLPPGVPTVVAVDDLLRALIVAYTEDAEATDAEQHHLRAVIGDRLGRAPRQRMHLPTPGDPRVLAVSERVAADLATPRAIHELARGIHVSPRTLSRLFRGDVGMTYPQWRTQLRLYRALEMLEEGRTVTDIAHACGWSSTSAFIDAFRAAFGETPGAARRPAGRDDKTPE
jgi:AraC-like DNA-binding protein